MTRGRGPQIYDSDVVLVTTTTRRSFLDDDDFDVDPSFISTKKAQRISNLVNDDIDALQRKSRRQDKLVLADYSPKLASPAYKKSVAPPPIKASRLTVERPLYTGRRASIHALSNAAPRPVVRRTRAPSPEGFFSSAPLVSTVSTVRKSSFPVRSIRAASEPPFEPTSGLASHNAKRYLDRIESEFDLENAFADNAIVSGYSRPRRGYYGAAPAGYGYGYVPTVKHVVPYVPHASHAPATYVPHASHAPATYVPSLGPRPRHRGSSLPPPSSPTSGRHVRSSHTPTRAVVIRREARETESVPHSRPPASVSSLRYATADAKNKLDTHKSMMDRYLPIYLGPENEVQYEVDYKFGELVQRMPSLDPYRPGSRVGSGAYDLSSRSSLPPRGPQGSNAHQCPKVSQARRRAREVLCRTKGNPHYYASS